MKDFPPEYAIEITCKITKEGPIPHKFIDEFPIHIKGLIQEIKTFEILGAQAAAEGDYDKALLAMVTNPLIANDEIGFLLLNEMLKVNKEYLELFK